MIDAMQRARGGKISPEEGTTDPFKAAQDKLFPGRRNRQLDDAARSLLENRVDIAEPILQRYLEKHPGDPAALNLMADIARRADRFEEAERLLLTCIENDPDCPGYRFRYAVIASTLGKYEDALAALDVLLKDDSENPLFRDWKAKVLSHLERFPEALTWRRELAEDYPQIATVWVAYGNLLRHLGKQEDAVAAYRKANEQAGDSIDAYMRLADLKTYRFSEAETARMQQLLSPGLSKEERANLCFTLGAAYGDQKRYAESFENCAKANALLRAGVDFDPDGLTAHRMNCERLFTEDFFRRRSDWGCESRAPIFIVGMPRSGSTLIEQMLSSHSAIEGLGELADLDNIAGRHLARLEGGQPREYRIGGWFEFPSGFVRAFSRAMGNGTRRISTRSGRNILLRPGIAERQRGRFSPTRG
jgi:tetratricopeptide (TPR) repeat protein